MANNNVRNLQRRAPTLFKPSVVRSLLEPPDGSVTFNLAAPITYADTSLDNTGSFRYNMYGQGLRSTQQLNIDWSKFENHTFFNSAQVKVNVAFDKIQNGFPFDGTQKETEIFQDRLTGFETYLYESYPKHKGYLFFSGTNGGFEAGAGTYVTVVDKAGSAYSDVARRTDAASIINPRYNSMTFEYWINVPPKTNDNQVIFSKHDGQTGFLCALTSSTSTTYATSSLILASGSVYESMDVVFEKDSWNHFAWIWNRTPGSEGITAYLNGVYYGTGSNPIEYGDVDVLNNLYIGSGSQLATFLPNNTLSGALDDLRIWHTIRSREDIYDNYQKSIFAQDNLKLYYKFNEPSGSTSPIVIDYSANSLHGNLSYNAYNVLQVRNVNTSSLWSGSDPVTYEDLYLSPILFPNHPDVVDYRTSYYTSASIYDNVNPNIITKLIPRHYLWEGQVEDALETEQGPIVDTLTAGADPRSTRLGATQVLLLLLYTWAKFFDELKLYIQAFSDLIAVDYDNIDTVPDQFLLDFARNQGFELPPFFTDATVNQFINGENISTYPSLNQYSLQYIQNQMWRRILVNLREIVTSKGTIHSIKTYIRSLGIDPDNNFRIREFGGPSKQNLNFARDIRTKISSKVSFLDGGLLTSPFLSASRVEPGYPDVAGTMSDGLLTSGSWTYEATYQYPYSDYDYTDKVSLVRFYTTGSSFTVNNGALITNLIAQPEYTTDLYKITGSLTLYVRSNDNSSSPYLKMHISGVNIFDTDKWYVSFGRQRNDDNLDSVISSSYFLRVAKNMGGEIFQYYVTQSYFNDYAGGGINVWNEINATSNASGSYFIIGSSSINTAPTAFLNDIAIPDESRITDINGYVTQIRFWSKYLEDKEWREHVRNYKSIGVQDPLTNFNFVTYKSGSFQRLRIDASTEQAVTQSDGSGNIDIFDYSQNNFTLSGTNFISDSQIIYPEKFYFSYISPYFDEASTTNKVRIRSFEQFEEVQVTPWAQVAPVYEIPKSEIPTDNTRFSIDFSMVDALNQDIASIFSTLDELDNVLGNPELLFSADYPGLENLRNVYFNRLTDKVSYKQFVEFFKWVDTNIGNFVYQLIPKKTKFYGTNFVIESHMLERPKFQYLFEDIYLGDTNRNSLKDTILLSFYTGDFVRY
jgi:hypothetical protein